MIDLLERGCRCVLGTTNSQNCEVSRTCISEKHARFRKTEKCPRDLFQSPISRIRPPVRSARLPILPQDGKLRQLLRATRPPQDREHSRETTDARIAANHQPNGNFASRDCSYYPKPEGAEALSSQYRVCSSVQPGIAGGSPGYASPPLVVICARAAPACAARAIERPRAYLRLGQKALRPHCRVAHSDAVFPSLMSFASLRARSRWSSIFGRVARANSFKSGSVPFVISYRNKAAFPLWYST